MSRVGQPQPSAPPAGIRRATGELPAQKAPSAPRSTSSQQAAASGFDTRRTYSKLTGVGSSKSRGNSHASLGRVDEHGADDSTGRNCGTPDDSIGRNRGTPDDSIGRNRGTPDDSIGGGVAQPPARPPARTTKKTKKKKKKVPSKFMDAMFGMLPKSRQNDSSRNKLKFLLGGGKTKSMKEKGMSSQDAIFSFLGFGPKDRDAAVSGKRKTSASGNGSAVSLFNMLDAMGLSTSGSRSPRVAPRTVRPASASATQDVLASRAFAALPANEQAAIRSIVDKGGVRAAAGIAEVFDTNQLQLLREEDANGVTVLQHLAELAQSRHPGLVGDLLSDIASPRDIEQGYAPTCTAASMQYELAKERPAEYVRLLAGLVLDDGVAMAGGGVLKVDVDAAITQSNLTNDQRSDSEAVFQTAAMEFANGADTFSIERQRSEGADKVYRGLYPEQIRTMVGELFGEAYLTREITTDAEAEDELSKLASREGPNRPVLFDLNMGSFNHLVSLESVTSTLVKYRDPATGEIHSMTRSTFIRSLVAVHYAESMGP